jgi:hypothetical protein
MSSRNVLEKTIVSTDNSLDTQDMTFAPEPHWTNIIRQRLPSQDTKSAEAYQTVNKWLTDCLQHHERCDNRTFSNLPKRIIEITGDYAYLRELHGTQAKYACLTHCWGKKGAALQLNSTTRESLRNGIAKHQLPKTFHDAVQICSRLEIRFIWIDAICKSYYLWDALWCPVLTH